MNGFGFDRFYGDEWAKFVKSVTLYGKTGDNYVYADAAYTTKVTKANLLELCMGNVAVVKYDDAYMRPVAFADGWLVLWDATAETPADITLYAGDYE